MPFLGRSTPETIPRISRGYRLGGVAGTCQPVAFHASISSATACRANKIRAFRTLSVGAAADSRSNRSSSCRAVTNSFHWSSLLRVMRASVTSARPGGEGFFSSPRTNGRSQCGP